MKKKVLLMGKRGAGKTSMRSIIFASYIAKDTIKLEPTYDVEQSHVRFLGNVKINIWDCGGQENFIENHLHKEQENVFKDVEILVYVFDVESKEIDKDLHYYQSSLEAILQHSPQAQIFCLLHKMDLVEAEQRESLFQEKEEDLKRLSKPLECTCFATSIWDESLYKGWSKIAYQLIPNVKELEEMLAKFAGIIDADEVVLFEKATFLVISVCERKQRRDILRFEKVSSVIKQFKMNCARFGTAFQSMEVRNSKFAAFIEVFTPNTYVMVLLTDTSIPSAITQLNIKTARTQFEKMDKVDGHPLFSTY